MVYGKFEMVDRKASVQRKRKTNAKRKNKAWSEQELHLFASVLDSNENRDHKQRRWQLNLLNNIGLRICTLMSVVSGTKRNLR